MTQGHVATVLVVADAGRASNSSLIVRHVAVQWVSACS